MSWCGGTGSGGCNDSGGTRKKIETYNSVVQLVVATVVVVVLEAMEIAMVYNMGSGGINGSVGTRGNGECHGAVV